MNQPLPDAVILETNDLLAELTKEFSHEQRLPGDITAGDLSKSTGLGVRRCSEILNEKVEKGLLLKIEYKSNKFVYRKLVNGE